MTPHETPKKYAIAGRCLECGERVVRGFADTGALVNVEIFGVTTTGEQMARTRGRGSYHLTWLGLGLTITARTDKDVLLRPAGFRAGDRVVLAHECIEKKG